MHTVINQNLGKLWHVFFFYFPCLVSHLAVDQLFLHVHVLWLWLKRGAQCGTCAEQPVVKLLCFTMVTL